MSKTLDRSRPYAQIIPPTEEGGHFKQDGNIYNFAGQLVRAAPQTKKPAASGGGESGGPGDGQQGGSGSDGEGGEFVAIEKAQWVTLQKYARDLGIDVKGKKRAEVEAALREEGITSIPA